MKRRSAFPQLLLCCRQEIASKISRHDDSAAPAFARRRSRHREAPLRIRPRSFVIYGRLRRKRPLMIVRRGRPAPQRRRECAQQIERPWSNGCRRSLHPPPRCSTTRAVPWFRRPLPLLRFDLVGNRHRSAWNSPRHPARCDVSRASQSHVSNPHRERRPSARVKASRVQERAAIGLER